MKNLKNTSKKFYLFIAFISVFVLDAQVKYFPWDDESVALNAYTPIASAPGTSILTDPYEKIYYVGNNNKVCAYYKDVIGNWQNFVLNNNAQLANARSGIVFDQLFNIFLNIRNYS